MDHDEIGIGQHLAFAKFSLFVQSPKHSETVSEVAAATNKDPHQISPSSGIGTAARA